MNKENNTSENSNSRTQGGSHEQHAEAGRKGGEASHKNSQSESSQSESSSSKRGGSSEQHAEAGRKGGEASHGSSNSRNSSESKRQEKTGEKGKQSQGRGKTKTVKYKTGAKDKQGVDKIGSQLDQIDAIEVWSIDPEDPDAILTVIMDEDGDVAIIETVFADAGYDIEPCSCNE